MKDKKNVERGSCRLCECLEYETPADGHRCEYCNHLPPDHLSLTNLETAAVANASGTSGNSFGFVSEIIECESPSSERPCNAESFADEFRAVHAFPAEVIPVPRLSAELNPVPGPSSEQISPFRSSLEQEVLEPFPYDLPACSTVQGTSTQRTSTSMTGQPQIGEAAFVLPKFSQFLTPFLDGTVDSSMVKMMRSQFMDEICEYLDSNKLLMSCNSREQALGYKKLSISILKQYPNIIVDDKEQILKNGKKKRIKNTGYLGDTITKIADRRRKRRKPKVIFITNADTALEALQDSVLRSRMTKQEKVMALRLSQHFRTNLDSLPDYLQQYDMLHHVAELFLETNLNSAEKLVQRLIGKLKSDSIYTVQDLNKYLSEKPPYFIDTPAETLNNIKPQVGPCVKMVNTSVSSAACIYVDENTQIPVHEASPIKLCIITWVIYYILMVSYPYNFRLFLGLMQNVFHTDKFKDQSPKFKKINDKLFR